MGTAQPNTVGHPTAGVTRRNFMKMAIATGALAAAGPRVWAAEGTSEIPQRELGRTGERVSCLGLGGSHIGKVKDEAESLRIIRTAIDRGLTFMDNSWDYNDGDGVSETRMGKALRDGYRDKAFLMTTVDGRTKKEAMKQLDESLKRLQTDHLDLWQLHECIRLEDPDRAFDTGGAIEALQEAKQSGKCRFIGFTGHKDPVVHLRMLEMAGKHNFRFDTVQMPLNVMDAHFRSFEHLVLPKLVEQGIGVLGMKSMGSGVILKSNTVKPTECLQYALNLPTSVVITGIDSMKILDQAIEAAKTFKPMSNDEVASLLARTAAAAKEGKFELFKTTMKFDSTAQHPQWLGEESS
jgi:predicted aldo/keto reductase-like oxidoreductase